MSTFVKEYEQLFNRLMNLQTKKAYLPDWVDDDTKVDKIYRPFHLGSLFSPRVTRFSKGSQRAYMIDLGGSFSPCFDTLEDLGRACQTRNPAFCPVTFETSDEWGDFSKVTISRFVLKDFGEWEMMMVTAPSGIGGEYLQGKDIDSLREVLQEKLPLVDLSMIHYNYDWIL